MQLRRMIGCLGVTGVIVLLSLAVPPLFGQQRAPVGPQFPSAYRPPRAADGHPDPNWRTRREVSWQSCRVALSFFA